MANWVIGKIKKIQFWTDKLFSLVVHAPIRPFIAGQFTKIRLKIDEKYIQRAYSYVNAPDNPNLEFYLIAVPNGKFSSYLAKLHQGDEIQVMSEASGFFVLSEIPDCATLWMLATGTAIGPYLSILEHGKDLDRFENIVLIHAVRYATDLSYLSRMRTLQQRYKGKLRVQTVVSREKTANELTGRIPSLIESGRLEQVVGLSINAETSHVMLCGNPQMVQDTQYLLNKTRKMTKNLRSQPGHMTSEYYW